ncbi:MAG TPA: hypothetical protein EYO89_02955, partial [Candidatus Dadabacteria bacterium]|nr:hypothetical protein [Candidatus Dadabacteria bacterium]
MNSLNFSTLIRWLITIQDSGYPWTLQKNPKGVDRCLLSSASLFCKLSKIYENYFQPDKEELKKIILSFTRKKDGMLEDISGKQNIISETRQAFSGLKNIGEKLPPFDPSEYFQEPLYFLQDDEWDNPWGAGAHLSHYLFFMKQTGQTSKISEALDRIKIYEHEDGWYRNKPDDHTLVNGIMKVMTAYDAAKVEIPASLKETILDYVFKYACEGGGCGIYDFVYVVDKCMDLGLHTDKCEKSLKNCFEFILKHQKKDGGFSYNLNQCQTSFYGRRIAYPFACGDVHGTTLLSMALVRIDSGLNLDY